MSEKHNEVLDAINKYWQENGYAPSIRELGAMVNFKSPASVHCYVAKLKNEGYMTWKPEIPDTAGNKRVN